MQYLIFDLFIIIRFEGELNVCIYIIEIFNHIFSLFIRISKQYDSVINIFKINSYTRTTKYIVKINNLGILMFILF